MNRIKAYIKTHPNHLLSYIYRFLSGKCNIFRIKGKENIIDNLAWLSSSSVRITGNANKVSLREGCYGENVSLYIFGNKNNVLFEEDCILKNVEIWIEDDNNTIHVGKGSVFSGQIHLAAIEGTTIRIGERCLFSQQITIRTGDSHLVLDKSTGKRTNLSKSVVIGDHCWIGHGVTILKGVTIEHDSIIATGSIVTKRFSDSFIIIGGIPAKVIKSSVLWESERK